MMSSEFLPSILKSMNEENEQSLFADERSEAD
jgi:hypothetical protein